LEPKPSSKTEQIEKRLIFKHYASRPMGALTGRGPRRYVPPRVPWLGAARRREAEEIEKKNYEI